MYMLLLLFQPSSHLIPDGLLGRHHILRVSVFRCMCPDVVRGAYNIQHGGLVVGWHQHTYQLEIKHVI